MAKIVLDRSGIDAVVGQLEAAGVAQQIALFTSSTVLLLTRYC